MPIRVAPLPRALGWPMRASEDCLVVVAVSRGAGRIFHSSKHRSRHFINLNSTCTNLNSHFSCSSMHSSNHRGVTLIFRMHLFLLVPLPSISPVVYLLWASGRVGTPAWVGGRRRCRWRLRRRLRRRCRGPSPLTHELVSVSDCLALFGRSLAWRSSLSRRFSLLFWAACLPWRSRPFCGFGLTRVGIQGRLRLLAFAGGCVGYCPVDEFGLVLLSVRFFACVPSLGL